MAEPIVECVPNFSEGLREEAVREIVRSMQVFGVSLLDWSMDAAHNRSVVTIAGPPEAVAEAAVRAVGKAAELIDLTKQSGVHPRIGAADVVPFVPVRGYSLAQCAMLARSAALQMWRRYGVPVYLYEAAAARPDRVNLEDVRRGQFEGLRDAVRREMTARPDVGGPELHATAGASAVGARQFLIAYNVYLDRENLSAARAVAKEIRASNGGLRGVKAMGVMAHGQAQVSMNVTDFHATSMDKVFHTAERLAKKQGAQVLSAELIGLIPEESYAPDADWIRPIPQFDPAERVLERRLERPIAWPQ
jgi:glutamate formiminotransferase